MPVEIWIADWVFNYKLTLKEKKDIFEGKPTPLVITHTVKDVVTKRIPLRFLINEKAPEKVLKTILPKTLTQLEKEFKIIYTKKIGETNE